MDLPWLRKILQLQSTSQGYQHQALADYHSAHCRIVMAVIVGQAVEQAQPVSFVPIDLLVEPNWRGPEVGPQCLARALHWATTHNPNWPNNDDPDRASVGITGLRTVTATHKVSRILTWTIRGTWIWEHQVGGIHMESQRTGRVHLLPCRGERVAVFP